MCRLRRQFFFVVLNLTWLLACAGIARGYLLGPALSLEKLAKKADLVFKGTAISSGPVRDKAFEPYPDFVARETLFQVISILKGQRPGDQLMFRHYDEDPRPQGHSFQPQFYHFEPGRTYVVFAKKGKPVGIFCQLWMYHRTRP